MVSCQWNSVKLIVEGSIVGTEKATATEIQQDTDGNYYFGGEFDLWGVTLTPAIVNASNFGFVISFVGASLTTHYLKATNFGFSIPINAIIKGVVAEIEASHAASGGIRKARVDSVKMKVYYTF